jgi:hypothetical protein
LITPLTLANSGTDQSEMDASSMDIASFCKAKPSLPAA